MGNDKAVFEFGGVKVDECKTCHKQPELDKSLDKVNKFLYCPTCKRITAPFTPNDEKQLGIRQLAVNWNIVNMAGNALLEVLNEKDKPQDIIEENPTSESLQTLDEKLFNDGPDVLTFEEKIKLFIESAEIKKQANIEIKNAQNIIDALQESLVDDFMDKEIISMKIYGKNIYFHKQAYAKVKPQDPECSTALPEDKQLALKTLRTLGLDEYITIGTMALSGYIRALEKDGESMPDELAKVISFEPKTSLRVRKG